MLQEGSQFGPYQLIKRIAYGGMAEIHLAKATGLGGFEKLLALKVIHPKYSEDQEFIDMLIDEAKIAVQLSHVNIGQIFDLGKIDSTYYIAMEFIDGKDLYQLLVKCSELEIEIPFDIIAFIGMELAAGLSYAHTKSDNYGRPLNLIHRDVSPQNILISYDGEVKLVDFGIAKASQRSRETESGVIKGKFFYMSPEQAWGDPVDARTDIFSAGICLYEMISGEMLYHEEKALVLLDKVRKAEIPNMRERRPGLPPELEAIALRALARDREQRYQTAAELQAALSGFLYKNWPGFNRSRLAEFMRQVFGEGRFVLPMPPPGAAPSPRPPAPAPAPEPAPEPTVPPTAPGGDDGSTNRLMRADEFVAQEHSVSFDLRSRAPVQPAAEPAATGPVENFDDDDRPVAGGYFPGVDRALDAYGAADDDEEEATIAEAVWTPDAGGGADDDTTAVIEMATVDAARRAVGDAPTPADPEPPTSLYDRPRGDLPATDSTPPERPPAATPAPATPPPRPSAPGGTPTRPLTPTRSRPRPAAAEPPASATPSPPPAAPSPSPPPAAPKPTPRPKPRNRASEAGRPTLHVTSAALGRPPAIKRLGRWLLTGPGITTLVLMVLAGYAAATFLPTLLSDPAPAKVTLILDSVPRGAAVTLDGKATGLVTPASLPELAAGANYRLVLELPGYERFDQVINISPEEAAGGREVRRRIFLDKAGGKLRIRSVPPGAEVYLDGKYVGDTPVTKRIEREKDSLLLLLRKEGYREERKVLEWKDRTEIDVEIELTKRGR